MRKEKESAKLSLRVRSHQRGKETGGSSGVRNLDKP